MFSDASGGDINSMTCPEGICSGYLKHKGIYCRVLNGLQSYCQDSKINTDSRFSLWK